MNFKEYTKKSLILLVLLQPFLDIYFLYVPPVTSWIPFSPATLIRIFLVAIITGLYIWSSRHNKANRFAWLYMAILVIYLVLHLIFTRHFKSTSPIDLGYSTVEEIFYWIRMVIPLVVLFVTTQIKVTRAEFNKVIKFLAWIISGSIVITNLFKISLSSYGGGWIQGNIFSWFGGGQQWAYYGLASKGFFYYANAVSAVEVLLTPLVLYYLVEKLDLKSIALVFVQMFAMLMLGTKTASLGFFIVLAGYIILYLIYSLLFKEFKFKVNLFVIFAILTLVGGTILPASPMFNRTTTDTAVQKTQDGTEKEQKEKKRELEAEKEKEKAQSGNQVDHRKETPLMKYIKNHYRDYSLNARFVLGGYSYRDDPQFWYQVMKWPVGDRLNYRKVEEAMLNRAKSVNNSALNNWFGISYTRMNHIANLEQDFISQWYSMGFIGVLLLIMPYVFVLLYCLYKVIRVLGKQATFFEVSLLFGSGLIIALSAFSGNVMDFLADTIILAFVLGYTLITTRGLRKHDGYRNS